MVIRNLADNLNYAFDETVLLDFRDDLSAIVFTSIFDEFFKHGK